MVLPTARETRLQRNHALVGNALVVAMTTTRSTDEDARPSLPSRFSSPLASTAYVRRRLDLSQGESPTVPLRNGSGCETLDCNGNAIKPAEYGSQDPAAYVQSQGGTWYRATDEDANTELTQPHQEDLLPRASQ